MLTLTVTVTGKNRGDLNDGLDEVQRLVSEDYLSGFDENDDGRYNFDISGDEEEAEEEDEAERFEAARAELTRMHNEKWPDASFLCLCPKCNGGDLMVTAATLVTTGKRVMIGEMLGPYGFLVPASVLPDESTDYSTDDEVVVCLDCKANFRLSEVTP